MSNNTNKKHRNPYHQKLWEHMMSGKCYTKGIMDSNTSQKVLACYKGNHFAPDNCYFAYTHELPFGTCYVDGE